MAVVAAIALSACGGDELRVDDFSKTFELESGQSKGGVVGLIFQTTLDSNGPIVMNIGCNGDVLSRITVTPGENGERRIDWYTPCAQASFSVGDAVPTSFTLSYRFQRV
ncbi:hypothetical protein ASF45_32010 [Pseudorhodoferax sp. Leaf265]|nr:hypothetical protein ASF45_32010 [Pseudorhodoferax sp. Leaf265]